MKVLSALISVVQLRMIIQSPKSLREQFVAGEIQASYANFGYIPYGHQMVSPYNHTHIRSRSAAFITIQISQTCANQSPNKTSSTPKQK